MPKTGARVRVVVADDHPFFRDGVSRALTLNGQVEVVAEAATGRETIEAIQREQPDVALVDYEMPDLIDTLVTTVEAGVALGGSLQIAARRIRGPLGEELRLLLQEQNLGAGMRDALQHLVERADTPAMRSFVRAIIQGEMLGVSVGESLRTLSTEMRARRRATAEERAQKAPIKMLFPLAFLIFPAIFIVLLGPIALNLHSYLGH